MRQKGSIRQTSASAAATRTRTYIKIQWLYRFAIVLSLMHSACLEAADPRKRLFDGPDGATCQYFNVGGAIEWRNRLGDWRDATGQVQGNVPFASARVNDIDPRRTFEWDLSKLLKRWSEGTEPTGGLMLIPVTGSPSGTIVFFSREAAEARLRPRLRMSFAGGIDEKTLFPVADTSLDCTTVASLGEQVDLRVGDQKRAAIEFDLREIVGKTVTRATLELTTMSVRHEAAEIGVFLLDPPLLDAPPARNSGIAAEFPRDDGIDRHPDVIFATGFESAFWRSDWSYISAGSRAERVERDDQRKFEPVVGSALRVAIAKGGNLGLDMGFNFRDKLGYEPEEIYFRYYVRFADDWIPTADGGKLPGPAGTYGRAGWGGRKAGAREGWSMRGFFGRSPSPYNPLHGRVAVGTYAYHAGGEDFFGDAWSWNLAGHMLERNRWYCIEQHLRMNTLGARDGILRAWVDGVLAFDKRDVYLRDTPHIKIEKIWMNVYHGGTAKAAEDLHLYLDNVVIARSAIGCLAR